MEPGGDATIITRRKGTDMSKERDAKLEAAITAVLKGETLRAAAARAHMDESTVRRAMARRGLKAPHRSGQRPTPIDVKTVLRRYRAGVGVTQLAREGGTTKERIRRILKGQGVTVMTVQIPPGHRRRATPNEIAELRGMTSSLDIGRYLVRLHAQGVPVTWACADIGKSMAWGAKHIREAGLALTRRETKIVRDEHIINYST